jgi:hypothetical protein
VNPAIASRLPSVRLVAAVAELGSLDHVQAKNFISYCVVALCIFAGNILQFVGIGLQRVEIPPQFVGMSLQLVGIVPHIAGSSLYFVEVILQLVEPDMQLVELIPRFPAAIPRSWVIG